MSADRLLVGVPRETFPGEARVALVPAVLGQLAKSGIDVVVEAGAGDAAGFTDDAYAAHGARIGTRDEAFAADVVARVRTGGADPDGARTDLERLRPDQIVIGIADAVGEPDAVRQVAEHKATLLALDLVPRITRAQGMDVLSSQATVVGYRAVVIAADHLPKMFPMLTTAAGTVPPAQVLVIGAGVAGLTAIATARRLGAIVQAYDVRPAAQEEIASVGARAVALPIDDADDVEDTGGYARDLGDTYAHRQQELLADVVAGVDAVITTASVPGRRAPVLVTDDAVHRMAPGSVVVDCSAERGGNCAPTRPGATVVTGNGVTVLGPTNLASDVAHEASVMYAKNVVAFLLHLVHDGRLALDLDDEIVAGTLVTHDGEVVHPQVLEALDALDGLAGPDPGPDREHEVPR
jgi:H+-translocating NAD(P) transhydrogenase subunit alpha